MRYQFTNEEVKQGDSCILIWAAPQLGSLKDDAPKGEKGETTYGQWHDTNGGMECMLPVIVEKMDDEYLMLRIYHEKEDGTFDYVYTKGQPEPLSLQIKNNDTIFTRLIKCDWKK